MGDRKLPAIDKAETGANIKRLMRKAKIDAYELASILGLRSTTNVYAWTQGRVVPNADSLIKLSSIFGCSVDDILIKEIEDE
jgi:transcriptional regulator with XRE-family HTH domain